MLNYLAYFGIAIVLLGAGIVLFEITTKVKEFELISKGNKAASLVLTGKILGLSVVLYSSISNSVSIYDLILWGAIAIITQIAAYYLAELLLPKFNIHNAINQDNQAVGLFLLALSVAIGLIVAGCLTY
ncbi:DUF350 domain-containing protein [Peribacillus deserti]|uniref:DUF350 domain-containing protein n=1 Tax=Peribacillus deserti TaxID=673318 RepID=UPI0019594AB5